MDDERTLGQTLCDEYFLSDCKGCPLKIWDCCPMENGVTFDELKEKIQAIDLKKSVASLEKKSKIKKGKL